MRRETGAAASGIVDVHRSSPGLEVATAGILLLAPKEGGQTDT